MDACLDAKYVQPIEKKTPDFKKKIIFLAEWIHVNSGF